jgi:outer membrane receptor protein involved in Fe transport
MRAGRPREPLALAIGAVLAAAVPASSRAQEGSGPVFEEIIVTATRRAESIQDIPINIAAFDGEVLDRREIGDLAQLGRNVPGLYVVDQGKRGPNHIVVRGLNLDTITNAEALDNNGGDVVSTYVGDIPLYVDLSLADMDRIEVLLGPQGTLYGAGTLGGAIRYIPRRPDFNTSSMTFRATTFGLAESASTGFRGGFTGNFPLSDAVALRFTVDKYADPGYIDTPYLVKIPGVSDPQPDLSDPAAVRANLYGDKDVNDENTVSGRVGLRWQPSATVDANFTYYFQNMDVGGRNENHLVSFGTGRYDSATRYPEPITRNNHLAAAEITADLGFAELTSATGYSTYHERGQRDQTDLLITLHYSYEAYPAFSAFTRDIEDWHTLSQEMRLVSKKDSRINWIGGVFYFDQHLSEESREFTPKYDQYLLNFGSGVLRPDGLEYISQENDGLKQKAVFGEIGFDITDKWQLTLGGRWYDYDLNILSGATTPLLNTVYYGTLPPTELGIELEPNAQQDSGSLYKLNTAYHFTPDLMGYVTISEGYRIGASNGVGACSGPNTTQTVCALPDEVQYFPDKTTNYEVGVRSQWLEKRLTLNGALYHIDWKDPQLASATVIGAQPITKNGKGARTQGVEVSLDVQATDRLDFNFSFSHTEAELSEDAARILRVFEPPGFGPYASDPLGPVYIDGRAGDRLPGSPENQGTVDVSYSLPLRNRWGLEMNYGIAAIGDVITKIGLRSDGERLPGYAVHYGSVVLHGGPWTVGLYGQNLFNKYAVTGVRSIRDFAQTVADENGDPVTVRSYAQQMLRPREIGLRFSYALDL